MADDDDLYGEEQEQSEVEGKQANQEAAFQRLQSKLEKAEKQIEKYKAEQEKAVTEKRNEALRNLAINFGNENIAELYPADAEVDEAKFADWASKYGWERKENKVPEEQQKPEPSEGLAAFHRGGGTPPSGPAQADVQELFQKVQKREMSPDQAEKIMLEMVAEGTLRRPLTGTQESSKWPQGPG